jgi:hypothetical protein
VSKIAEMRHRQGGVCQRQALVFDAKREYMTKMVSTTRGVNDKGGEVVIPTLHQKFVRKTVQSKKNRI